VPTVAAAQDEQTAFLLGEVARLPEPTIIAGDFNSTRDTPFHARLRRTLVDALERGSQGFGATVDVLDWLGLRIDYVYTPPSMDVVDAEIPPATCSDHRPIVTRMHPPMDAPTAPSP
jgi:endonuclease/exonuclease/phosphatase (EEP) superfamily protein YafD